MKKLTLVILCLLICSVARAEENNRYQLYSHGNLLYKIDTQTGSTKVLIPDSAAFADVQDYDMSAVKDPGKYLDWYDKTIIPIIRANTSSLALKKYQNSQS